LWRQQTGHSGILSPSEAAELLGEFNLGGIDRELKIDILGAGAAPPSETFPPFIINEFPPNGTIDRPRNTNLSFRIDDVESGIDLNSVFVEVSVDGGPFVDVLVNGLFQVGFQGPGSSIVAGGTAGYDITIDPEADFANFAPVVWNVSGDDQAPIPNSVSEQFTFNTEDDLDPFITNRIPPPGSTDVSTLVTVTFKLNDLDNQVVQSLINVTVDEGSGAVPVITNGVFIAPYNGPGSSLVSDGFNWIVTVDKTSAFTDEVVIEWTAIYEDAKGNQTTDVWQWDTVTPPPPGPPVVAAEIEGGFPFDMYRFIIFEIRRKDLQGSPKPGSLFLKRYLEGPNAIWQDNVAKIQSIPDIWSVTKIDDRLLTYLKWIVGWTDEEQLKKITDAVDDATLRRLIAASGRLWNTRGPEDAVINAMTCASGTGSTSAGCSTKRSSARSTRAATRGSSTSRRPWRARPTSTRGRRRGPPTASPST
jgi:hypothetical protein